MPRVVHVVDDDASFQKATRCLLEQAGYKVASYPSAKHLLDHLPNESARGCILLEVKMAGPCSPCLSILSSALPVIFLTRFLDIPTVVRAIKAGADDFLLKPVSSDQLLRAVGRAIAHYDATRGAKGALNIVRARIATLTPREREVFELVIRGATNKHAASSLGCTERTVKAHRHRMMEKMQVRSVPELVSLAEPVGITSGNGHSALSHLASFSSASISKACSTVEQHTKTREDADYEVKSTQAAHPR